MALKYKNQPVVIDGLRFASRAEAKRYGELKLLERAREIGCLECQPRYPLKVNGKLIATYVADFFYFERGEEARAVVEDQKGFETPVFKLKEKLFRALYPQFDLRIVRGK